MSVKTEVTINKIKAGYFSIAQLETLKRNAMTHPDGQLIVEACNQQLRDSTSTRIQLTRERGISECIKELERRGANVISLKEGNKLVLEVIFGSNKPKRVLVRSKSAGAWQTTIRYAKQQTMKDNESEFWIFVDLEYSTPKFYIAPSWWIQNNIHECHEKYLARNGGHRKLNDLAEHHSIELARIKKWEECWELLENVT
ncbi:hypothetical protein G6329_17970 [Vibrio cholerae]|nr:MULTISPECIES: hypothetical protein [Vibrio]EGQ9392420.1 hypothetical protein [Vibrio cholerae]EGQ9414967.1 hypothetical protein [Vibrio cholerae]EGR0503001.1 hypothetical protein [Vibrio cholerae]EGR0538960.1 hypothetical protein [Vibrio cholerae]EGR0667170.1 hypothetical protein [Vibrio cholerae]